ncbi:MAG: hypothetical protein ACREMU_07295, partial [Gemmatimonadaceae bacterium]
QDIVHAVEREGVRLIILDSLNGYLQAMPSERLLLVQIQRSGRVPAQVRSGQAVAVVRHVRSGCVRG